MIDVRRDFFHAFAMTLGMASLFAAAAGAEPTAEQAEFFEKKVRPILVERCYECHSEKTLATNEGEAKGNLRLDSRQRMLTGGDTGPAIEPGAPDKSLLVQAIRYDGVYLMPPIGKMPDDEIAILTKWISEGAVWPGDEAASADDRKVFDIASRKASHWCWQPIVDPAVPAVTNQAWPLDPIDAFILAKLEANSFQPAPMANPRARLRRLSFDLLGLPPTPQELAEFEANPSAVAWENAVDRMLASPRFGERWGRHWLDLARYAETRGHEFDFQAPNAWAYRDYVIRAFNGDVPYRQFVVEQIAGDLLSVPRREPRDGFNESVVGTGIWSLGEWVHSPVDILKDEADRYDNMLDVFGKTFLGLTIACARCHDHKFDAIATKDYYALAGVLQSTSYRLARYDTMEDEQKTAFKLFGISSYASTSIARTVAWQMVARLYRNEEYVLAALDLAQPQTAGAAPDLKERVEQIAKEKSLVPKRLLAWATALQAAADDPSDALYPLAKLFARSVTPEARRELLRTMANRPTKSQSLENDVLKQGGEVVVDYSSEQAPFIADGPTFGTCAIQAGEVIPSDDPAQPIAEVAEYGAVRRDPVWNGLKTVGGTELDPGALAFDRAGKTLRTPTFELKDGRVHYLVRGAGKAYACVDSHAVVLGPLHGEVMLSLGENGEAPVRWVSQDLRRYTGHRIHIEFVPHADQDLQVLMVVAGPTAPTWTPPPASWTVARRLAQLDPVDLSATQAARAMLDVVSDGFKMMSEKDKADDTTATWINWALAHPDLWANEDEFVTDKEEAKRFESWKRLTASIAALFAKTKQKYVSQIKPESRLAMAMWDGTGEDERVMVRGNPHIRGGLVERRLPEAFAAPALSPKDGSRRLELAQQLFRDDNPLTRRVMVNRLWAHLFGRGIVPSVDNFGVLGSPPSHPELLDHLAVRFAREDWSIKQMIRAMVCSQTYQMESASRSPADEERDPKNLLLRRQNVKRLESESIRDSILVLSGRLTSEMFGPSVPIHLTDHLQGRGRPGVSGPLDGAGRRSIYQAIRRNFPNPFLTAFDSPTPLGPVGQRNVSNVPAQALILLNDPLVMEQTRLWAESLAKRTDLKGRDKLDLAMQTALGRPSTAAEQAAIEGYLTERAKQLKIAPDAVWDDPRTLAEVCHVLVNTKEFVFVE
jgi:cytochrome c553